MKSDEKGPNPVSRRRFLKTTVAKGGAGLAVAAAAGLQSKEAEAAGIRATGIGCYFDDTFHDILGLAGDRFQDLYHFTVGGPVDDPRLMTLPPYAHLNRP